MTKKAIVLFSGGQDSTTCLYWAKKQFDEITAVNIDYGQRHQIEIDSARRIAVWSNTPIILINTFKELFPNIGDSALVSGGDISKKHRSSDQLPASFLPGRNLLFLTIVASIAYKEGIHDIVTGVCQTDYSGYPDCRRETIDSLENTLSLGLDYPITIHTPLMHLTKAETVRMASNLEGCLKALSYSHTCYEGEVPPCGKCPACELRTKGFKEAGISDPLIERLENA
jgi:7-cyano-7-deazaguanine synthase